MPSAEAYKAAALPAMLGLCTRAIFTAAVSKEPMAGQTVLHAVAPYRPTTRPRRQLLNGFRRIRPPTPDFPKEIARSRPTVPKFETST
jgi:hypothetical protein